jgi:hypothetical protein
MIGDEGMFTPPKIPPAGSGGALCGAGLPYRKSDTIKGCPLRRFAL